MQPSESGRRPTGQTPAQFREYVYTIAKDMDFSTERLILGGDHLGPNPWRVQSAATAMEKACAMVSAYAAAGFSKIHLDASMPCGDDPRRLGERGDRRPCSTTMRCSRDGSTKLLERTGLCNRHGGTNSWWSAGGNGNRRDHNIGRQETLDTHRQAFSRKKLASAWDRIIGVVVQPGVEFGNETVADYVQEKASHLAEFIVRQSGVVFEAHSTDYQTTESLSQLVSDHFGILKVGPELTFMMRQAIFGLARIEEEWIAEKRRSDIRITIDRAMVEHPENWKAYYHGNESPLKVARAFSLSDRIRYYWPNAEVSKALSVLIRNLQEHPAPLPLVAQYLPRQAEAIRACTIKNEPCAIIRHKIQESLSRYSEACGMTFHE